MTNQGYDCDLSTNCYFADTARQVEGMLIDWQMRANAGLRSLRRKQGHGYAE